MFIQVRLLNGFQIPLWYTIPGHWDTRSYLNTIVQVPVRTQILPALVIHEQNTHPGLTMSIKAAKSCELLPSDPYYHLFIKQLSAYYQIEPIVFMKRIRHFLYENAAHESPQIINPVIDTAMILQNVELTEEQIIASNFLKQHIDSPCYAPIVLHGVTGSGKTEVYKQAIVHALDNQKTVLFLLPEVTLALNFEQRLRRELKSVPLFGFHSATPKKDKKILWQKLIDRQPVLIIGVHLPVLLPIANLGMIIIDEEHDVGYQEKKHPKINTKEAAIWRSTLAQIPIVLGSATPSINTLYNVQKRQWPLFELKKRFAGAFPSINIVRLTEDTHRKQFWITQQLEHAIRDRLEKQEQTILFLNRRGFSFFVQCKQCSFIFSCNNCSVSLTLHDAKRLLCHYCGTEKLLPPHCPSCTSKEDTLLTKGIGTQQVVDIIQRLFPQARIGRADLDITTKKKLWQQTMVQFSAGELDILVGTQTITKGYDFPRVTLVGILWADLNLNFPLYNATETALQQLIQVAGRAGRHQQNSTVIVQSMRDHTLFNYLNERDYRKFYDDEITIRSMVCYPPCYRLGEIVMKHSNPTLLDQEAQQVTHHLLNYAEKHHKDVQILGPAQPPVHKIKNIHMRKLYIKSNSMQEIVDLYQHIEHSHYKSMIFFTPNPITA